MFRDVTVWKTHMMLTREITGPSRERRCKRGSMYPGHTIRLLAFRSKFSPNLHL